MKKYLLTIALTLSALIAAVAPQTVLAQAGALNQETFAEKDQQDQAFIETSGIQPVHISVVVAAVIRVMLTFLGVIFICLMIFAGFRWMTSAGNEEAISKAKRIMIAAIIGVVIVILAFAITTFVFDTILKGRSNYYNV